TLSGETLLHDDPGVRVYRLSRDPRGGLVLVSVHEDTGGWRVDLRRFSSTAALIDGPRTMTRGRGASPPSFDWGTFIASDGTILTVTQGWHVPPLRNNQLVARWFDPAGAPVTPWFVALDQTVEG